MNVNPNVSINVITPISDIYAHDKESVEIREEKHDDVIYSITVKKDNRDTSKQTPNSFDTSGIAATSKHIKGATLTHMVTRLARVYTTENEDVNFLNVFFTTYRTFSDPETVLNILLHEYEELEQEFTTNAGVLQSIVRVLKAWLERYGEEDFYQPPHQNLLKKVMILALRHDGIEDENCNVLRPKSDGNNINENQRKNGITNSFSSYVTTKIQRAERRSKLAQDARTKIISTSSQEEKTNPIEENYSINEECAKQFLDNFSSGVVAEQLTLLDAKLFVNILPHHCLAAVTSKKRPVTVQATKDQFNKVVYCVRGTILCPGLKCSVISKLIAKWIDVAQECREMKNFSSLFAIVSCLNTHAIHRLKRAWLGVSHEHTTLLQELNDLNIKDLIMKVGTAKFNTEESNISKVRKDATLRRNQGKNCGVMRGTVPYLGSFLTDLVHLDTALSDHLEGGLINFEKRRRAFEVLAQLQLWQASCRSYQNTEAESEFTSWFKSVAEVSENQSFKISDLIEPSTMTPSLMSPIKNLKDASRLQSRSSDVSLMHHLRKSKDIEAAGKLSQSFSSGYSHSPNRPIKVRVIQNSGNNFESFSAFTNYKTIQITSNERTNAVIRKILNHFSISDKNEESKNYSLVQILDGNKELKIPESENVYYAMNSTETDPIFLLLENGAEIPLEYKKTTTSTLPRKNLKKHRKNNSVSLTSSAAGDIVTSSLNGIRSCSPNIKSSASPMKSLYKQLAFGSVGVSSGSYSPSVARKRNDNDKVSIKSLDDKKKKRGSDKYNLISSISKEGALLTAITLDSRRYSADTDTIMTLPIQNTSVQTAEFFSQDDYLPMITKQSSRSAPCSPKLTRKKTASDILSTSEESANYGERDNDNGYTWSRRRAVRKNHKSNSSSTKFYLADSLSDVDTTPNERSTPKHSNSSKFSISFLSPLTKRKNKRSSKSSKTLPSKLTPDYTAFKDPCPVEDPISPCPSEAGSNISDNVFDDEFKRGNSLKKFSAIHPKKLKNYSLTLPPRITIEESSPKKKDSRYISSSSSASSSDSEPFVEITML